MKHIIPTITVALAFILSPNPARAEQTTEEPELSTWLGVLLTQVPDPLDEHLHLDGKGLSVRNVYKNSPADQAGIDRSDVIVKMDGEAVVNDIKTFSHYISDKQPGDSIELDVYQKGQLKHIKVTLAARPSDWSVLERKYADLPCRFTWKSFRDEVLRYAPDDWALDDLKLRQKWMDSPWRKQLHDYEGDAYDMWRQHQKQYHDTLDDWRKQYEKYNHAIEDWREHMKDSLPTDKWEQWQEWYDHLFQGPLQELKPPAFDSDESSDAPSTQPSTEPQVRFEQQPDGKITVHVHKGDAELSQTFDSVDDLQKNAPKLYGQYQSLHEQIR